MKYIFADIKSDFPIDTFFFKAYLKVAHDLGPKHICPLFQ